MLKITTTDQQVLISQNEGLKNGFSKNSLRYAPFSKGVYIYKDNQDTILYYEDYGNITCNDTVITKDNINEVFEALFKLGSGAGVSLPIGIANVTNLQKSLDNKVEKDNINALSNNILDLNPSLWEQGAMNAGVVGNQDTLVDTALRLRSKLYTRVESGSSFNIGSLDTNFRIVVKEYDLNKNYIKEPVVWSSVTQFTTSSNTKYLRYLIRKSDNSSITTNDLDLNIIYIKERI